MKLKVGNCLSISDKIASICFFFILIIGLFLRFYFYISNRDLGADEAHLALNFIHYGYKGLTQPLENFQSAPIFFLWSVETITKIFGFSEPALRLVPFIFAIISFPFFYFFVRDLTKSKIIALIAFLLFALNWSVLYFATELKPYTIDVFSFIFIGFLLFSDWDFVARRRMLLLAVIGGLLILFSISSVVILLGASLYMIKQFYDLRKKNITLSGKTNFMTVLFVWSTWGIVFLMNYFIFIYKHPYGEGMKNIWSWTFCPKNIFSKDFVIFINNRLEDTLFSNLLFFSKDFYFIYFLFIIFFVAVINMIVNKRFNIFLFTLFPIIVHLILSMWQLYPFYQRFILYLLPALILLFSYGLGVILNFCINKLHWFVCIPIIFFFLFATNINSVKKYYWTNKEKAIKPVFNYIDKHYPNTPILLVTPYTLYRYYFETGRVKNKNFKPIDWELKPDNFYNHKLIVPLSQNYLLVYSVGDNCDGYGKTLNDLKAKGLVVNQFNYSIFGVTELKPIILKGQGELIQNIDYQNLVDLKPSVQGSKYFIPLWNNNPISFSTNLEKGKIYITINGKR